MRARIIMRIKISARLRLGTTDVISVCTLYARTERELTLQRHRWGTQRVSRLVLSARVLLPSKGKYHQMLRYGAISESSKLDQY